MEEMELQHHGVRGMKWGVRRYQNKDGSLTAAGKKRQDKIDRKSEKKEKTKPAKRKLSEVSDDELQKKIRRMELEKRYKDLAAQSKSGRAKQFIAEVAGDSAKSILKQATVSIGSQALAFALGVGVNAASKKAFGIKDNIVDPKLMQKKKK